MVLVVLLLLLFVVVDATPAPVIDVEGVVAVVPATRPRPGSLLLPGMKGLEDDEAEEAVAAAAADRLTGALTGARVRWMPAGIHGGDGASTPAEFCCCCCCCCLIFLSCPADPGTGVAAAAAVAGEAPLAAVVGAAAAVAPAIR